MGTWPVGIHICCLLYILTLQDGKTMTDEIKGKDKSAHINKVLGLFILYFGIVIIGATFYTETLIGQLTNLVAGIVLLGIGVAMVLMARKSLKNLQEN